MAAPHHRLGHTGTHGRLSLGCSGRCRTPRVYESVERSQFLRAIAPRGFTYDDEYFETVDFPDWTMLSGRPEVSDSRLVPRTGFEQGLGPEQGSLTPVSELCHRVGYDDMCIHWTRGHGISHGRTFGCCRARGHRLQSHRISSGGLGGRAWRDGC